MRLVITSFLARKWRVMRFDSERSHSLILAVLLMGTPGLTRAASSIIPRERVSFNTGWLFAKGDPAGSGTHLDYTTLKPWLLAIAADLSAAASASLAAGR